MYTDIEFNEFLHVLLTAEEQSVVEESYLKIYKKYPHLRYAVSLNNFTEQYFGEINIRFLNGDKAVTPFFNSNKLLYLSDEIIESKINGKDPIIPLDTSIMLDTNCASYIRSFIYRDNIVNYQEVINIIDQLLLNKINFDYIYYLIENYKQVDNFIDEKLSIDEYWNKINTKMKENIIALIMFLSIDKDKYRKNLNTTPTVSFEEAELTAKNTSYQFYFENPEVFINPLKRINTITKIILYKIIYIKFSSKKSTKNKSKEFVEFMIKDLECYLTFEHFLAIEYFNNKATSNIFKKINKKTNREKFKKQVENITWDLMIPKYVQYLSFYMCKDNGFFIPFFLSFDRNLNEVLKIFEVKAFIYNNISGTITALQTYDAAEKINEYFDKREPLKT